MTRGQRFVALALLVGLVVAIPAPAKAQGQPEIHLVSAGIHRIKTVQGSESAEVAGGVADLLTATPPFGVLTTYARVTEPPPGPSRYAFLAMIQDDQAMYPFEGRRENEAYASLSFAFVTNSTPSDPESREYDAVEKFRHDDRLVTVGHAVDTNHVTVWCGTPEACEEVRIDVRNALQLELRRQSAAIAAVEALLENAKDLSASASPNITQERAEQIIRDVGAQRIEAAGIALTLEPPFDGDGAAVELRGPLRDAIVLSNQQTMNRLDAQVAAAGAILDRAEERVFHVEELRVQARTDTATTWTLALALAAIIVETTAILIGILLWAIERRRREPLTRRDASDPS